MAEGGGGIQGRLLKLTFLKLSVERLVILPEGEGTGQKKKDEGGFNLLSCQNH